MKTAFILSLFMILNFSSHCQIDSVKSKFRLFNITNIFKKKAKESLQKKVTTFTNGSDSTITTDTSKNVQRSISNNSDTSSKKINTSSITDESKKKIDSSKVISSNIVKVDTLQFLKEELIKRIGSSTDTTTKSINIFIVGGENIDVNVSQGAILTVNKMANPNVQYPNMNYTSDNKKKGFLSDMDSSKLTSLITLILASLPIIISSFK